MTLIEQILSERSGRKVRAGDIVDVEIDVRVARDFGGANVIKHIQNTGLGIADPQKTFFTFDCNPCGSDQKYAANQQLCRIFAREYGIKVYDINAGIGTHLAIDEGLIAPGGTFVSTDSHANILGAIGAFGQGMGDRDIAHAFAYGRVWFEVPPTLRVLLTGKPSAQATPKDVALALLKHFGADGTLGKAVELSGDYIDGLALDGRITIASMATEMGAVTILIYPDQQTIDYCRRAGATMSYDLRASDAAVDVTLNIEGLPPLIARPGHPEDVVPVSAVKDRKIDSGFIGSCTNGRLSDLKAVAEILRARPLAPGVVLKIVPATDRIWQECLNTGIIEVLKQAGVLLGNAGCAGCAAGQIGQNGPQEVTVSTGNRNFPGKQGAGEVYLASPATVAASAVAGVITTSDAIPSQPVVFTRTVTAHRTTCAPTAPQTARPTTITGRIWILRRDNIDTDMIFHNRHLTVTRLAEMGQYALGNLPGWEDFARKAKPGDIIVAGRNFGAGSSRQQAVDCFISLGISAIVAASFGAIYKRNAINAGLPVITAELVRHELADGDEIEIDFTTGRIHSLRTNEVILGTPFSEVQMEIYQKGGLLNEKR